MIMTRGERPRASWIATLAVGAMVVAAWSFAAPRANAQQEPPRMREMRQPPPPPAPQQPRYEGRDDANRDIESLTREVEALSRHLAEVTRRLNDIAERLDGDDRGGVARFNSRDAGRDAPVRGGWFGSGSWGGDDDEDEAAPTLAPGSSVRVDTPDREEQSPFVEAGKRSFARRYWLPEGKLDAITELMSRDDVPVLVRPGSNEIELIGSEEQHRAFEAFLEMIAPPTDSDWPSRMSQGAPLPSRPARPMRAPAAERPAPPEPPR